MTLREILAVAAVAAVAICLAVFLTSVFFGAGSSDMGHRMYDTVSARVVKDPSGAVTITRLGSENPYLDRSQPFTIQVAGEDISNQASAERGGRVFVLEPAEGLARNPNATITIRPVNATTCVGRLLVIANFASGERQVIVDYADKECCGLRSYDHNASLCCQDTVFPRTSGNTRCCGAAATELPYCCNNIPTKLAGCCNGTPYDPAVAGCCREAIFPLSESGCCNNRLIDNRTTGCCNARPYDYATEDCCGSSVYSIQKEYCCNNRVITGTCNQGIADIALTGIHEVTTGSGMPGIAGSVVNKGTVTYTTVEITVRCYDASGVAIDTFTFRPEPGRNGILKGGYFVHSGSIIGAGSMDFLIPARNPATRTIRILRVYASHPTQPDVTSGVELLGGDEYPSH